MDSEQYTRDQIRTIAQRISDLASPLHPMNVGNIQQEVRKLEKLVGLKDSDHSRAPHR